MVDIEQQLLEKRCKVICKNGFVKFGILKRVTDKYVALQLLDGKVELISFEAIDTVKEDGGGR